MDGDTKDFLQHIFDSLKAENEKLGSRIDVVEQRLGARMDGINSRMDAIERRFGQMNRAITSYGVHVERMLASFAMDHETLDTRVSAQIADLDRRVTALEQRQSAA